MTEILRVFSPVTTLNISQPYFLAGSEDGTLRIYDTRTLKVCKALRLSSEISSVIPLRQQEDSIPDIWVACGHQLLFCKMDNPQMILSEKDTSAKIDIAKDEDVLNELALNVNSTFLAFSLDSGGVGVVNLSSHELHYMKTKHDNICGTVKFIPNRPRELVSAGYDETILHFDYMQGTVLSRIKMPGRENFGEMSLSPPFIICSAISSEGIMAAGTADGRLWIGLGGLKPTDGNKKKARKWGGLNDEKSLCIPIAEGPIVALTFSGSLLILSTMLGTLKECLIRPDTQDVMSVQWSDSTTIASKVNSLETVESGDKIYVAGITKDGKGAIEIWDRNRFI